MDQNIGRMLEFLESRGALENTVIFFLSDNGCSAEPMGKNFGYKWGINTRWNYPAWRKNSDREGASQGRVWSIASNSPFRKNKKFTHEGGISTPLIVHWPEGIRDRGTTNNKIAHVMDIMATCIDLAEAHYPRERNGIPVLGSKGISLYREMKGRNSQTHESVFWEHEGHRALRKGKWKLVSVHPVDPDRWELYDMEKDRTETNDLSEMYPELREEMINEWKAMALELKVLPWPDYKNSTWNPVDK
jgi:arylsulfatase